MDILTLIKDHDAAVAVTLTEIDAFFAQQPALAQLTAVKEGRVFVMDKALYSMKPNARWGEAYEALEAILNHENR